MKRVTVGLVFLFAQLTFISASNASDFDWLQNLDVIAEADASGFRIQLATHFELTDTQVSAVISNVRQPSDAYMVLRLGELSQRPVNEVINVYRTHRKKGWGALAKRLGIKPGSSEFHALKRGHDMGTGAGHDAGHSSQGHPGKGNRGMGKGAGKSMGRSMENRGMGKGRH